MGEKTKELAAQETKTELNMETTEVAIKNLIYVIRGQQVMLDSDLAMLYQVETKVLNQAVKRNLPRFPESFRFRLNKDEFTNLKSQIVTSSSCDDSNYGGRRKLPFVFTEQGIAMLSAVAYHVGASLKDAGKKCFAINRIEDKANILNILKRIKKTDNGGIDDGRE